MTTTTYFCVRMDSNLKKQCEALYGLRVGGFPFDVRLEQQKKSKAPALSDAERQARDSFAKRCSSVEQVLSAIEK